MRAVVLLLSLLVGSSASAQDPSHVESEQTPFVRADVTAIAEQLACYCGCPHMQVSTCFCGTADSIRADIAAQLDAGRTPEQIIAAYVDEHGTWGLAVPPKEGFNLVIWLLPAALLVGGALLVFLLGARWSRSRDDDSPFIAGAEPATPALDADQRARLERALSEED